MSRTFAIYAGRVPAEAELVCYWLAKAGRQIASGKTARAVACTRGKPLHWAAANHALEAARVQIDRGASRKLAALR